MRPEQVHLLIVRRQRRKYLRARSVLRRTQQGSLGLLALVLLAAGAALLSAGLAYSALTRNLPPVSRVAELLDPASGLFLQPTRVYDRTGEHLLLTLQSSGVQRRYLKSDPAEPDHFSPELVRVTIALLDPGFWQHAGFRWNQLTDPQPQTIAERLAADLLLPQEEAGTQRALRMRILAAQLVTRYGRPQVLEWYLNSVPMGRLSYGAESAARTYLDRSASELSLADAALLVPLALAPALNPIDAPVAALERRDAALDQLFELGVITSVERDQAAASQPRLNAAAVESVSLAPAFTDVALEQAAQFLGRARLERGGLRLVTTLDFPLQLQASCLLATQINRLEGRGGSAVSAADGSDCLAASLLPTLPDADLEELSASAVLLDPRSGQILALVGDGQDGELLAHAPGSLLSPFAAVAAFARGYSPASLVWDIPTASESEETARLNIEAYRGPLRLRMSLANDILRPQVGLIDRLGGVYVWRLASSLGMPSLGLPGLTDERGADERSVNVLYTGPELSPLEIAAGYGVFASQGSANGRRTTPGGQPLPNALLYIEDARGLQLLDGSQPESQSLLSAALAYLVHDILSDEPARRSSLGYPNPFEIGRPVGAKAGHVAGDQEVWSVGYTPQRLAVVWLGSAEDGLVDPLQAAAIWHALMQYTSRDLPAEDWPVPEGISRVKVCDPSGQLPTRACPAVVDEVFLTGNEPVSADTLYQVVEVNRETNRLATVFTAPALVEERVYMMVPPEARLWAEASGLQLAPEVYDVIQPPEPSAEVQVSKPQLFAYVSGQVQVRGSAAGADFVSYRLQAGEGLNPQSWLQIGEESRRSVQDGLLSTWDTAGLDGLYALRLVVARTDSRVESTVIQVTVDNTSPLARVTYPLNGQEFSLPTDRQITFLADASDGVGLARLEWLLDGKKVGENLVPPYSLAWTAADGQHSLVVRAVDLAGNVTESAALPFRVKP